jgi:hypothetical protein
MFYKTKHFTSLNFLYLTNLQNLKFLKFNFLFEYFPNSKSFKNELTENRNKEEAKKKPTTNSGRTTNNPAGWASPQHDRGMRRQTSATAGFRAQVLEIFLN